MPPGLDTRFRGYDSSLANLRRAMHYGGNFQRVPEKCIFPDFRATGQDAAALTAQSVASNPPAEANLPNRYAISAGTLAYCQTINDLFF